MTLVATSNSDIQTEVTTHATTRRDGVNPRPQGDVTNASTGYAPPTSDGVSALLEVLAEIGLDSVTGGVLVVHAA